MNYCSNQTHWQERKFGELFRIKHGYAFKGEYFSTSGSYIVLTPGNFYEEGGFKSKEDKEKYYTGKIPSGFTLNKGDLIVAMTEQAEGLLGSAVLVPHKNLYLHNQRLGLITELDEANLNKFFLYYLFNSRDIRTQIRASANGTKIRHTSPERIYQVKVKLPGVRTQQKIVSILSAYDRLIENNTRRIKILEEMARSLYREWFVNFRFPGHEQVKMVDSELGLIPEGWEVKYLPKICSKVIDGTHDSPKSVNEGYHLVTGRHIINGFIDFSKCYFISLEEHEKVMKRSRPEKGDIIFSNIGTLGSSVLVDQNFEFSIKNVALFKPLKAIYSSFLYLYFSSAETLQLMNQKASGTSQKFFSLQFLRSLELAVPSSDILAKFDRVTRPVLEQRSLLNKKNQTLRRNRDLLLPKLISGEIDVENLDIETEVAA